MHAHGVKDLLMAVMVLAISLYCRLLSLTALDHACNGSIQSNLLSNQGSKQVERRTIVRLSARGGPGVLYSRAIAHIQKQAPSPVTVISTAEKGGGLFPGGYGIYLYYTSTLFPALLKTYSSVFIDGNGGIF